jgi:hypothetical protein
VHGKSKENGMGIFRVDVLILVCNKVLFFALARFMRVAIKFDFVASNVFFDPRPGFGTPRLTIKKTVVKLINRHDAQQT